MKSMLLKHLTPTLLTGILIWSIQVQAQTYKIGDTHPCGGIVFTVDASGQKGFVAYTEDLGKYNFADAGKVITEKLGAGWTMPNKDQLNQMYVNLHKAGLGNFKPETYRTGQESGYPMYPWAQNFANGKQEGNGRFNLTRIRAIKAFPCGIVSNIVFNRRGLYFDGSDQYAEFAAPAGMPGGPAPRTIEFWMKSDLRAGAKDNHESIIELGEPTVNGSAFGIYSQVSGGKTQLCFWGNMADKVNIGEIPDDQWHFVAITYSEPEIKCYIDGELKSTNSISTTVGGQRLNTKVGKCYLGGFPGRGWYFKGAVSDLVVWNTARTAGQIKTDMIPFPCLQGNEAGLVAHFPLNDGGLTFKSSNGAATGALKNATAWTKAIQENPDPISEGIWFVIQNKNDVDADTDVTARRMALKANPTGAPTMAQIPLTGNYDDFLWRTMTISGGKYKLINKKLGMAKALDCNQTNPVIAAFGNNSSQSWVLSPVNIATMGTNAYTMSNDLITTAKALTFANNQVVVAAGNKLDTKQAWVFQPVSLVEGYHIPQTADANCPTSKMLKATDQVTVYGTNTTSDWAMLNTQLIIKNMLNARLQPCPGLAGNKVYIISQFDYDANLIAQYPLVGIPAAWIADTRGGTHYGNYRLTMVTEEMMCRTGVVSRGASDRTFREFDQVIHEFGHAMGGFGCSPDQYAITDAPNCGLDNKPQECFAASVQAWFNNNYSYGIIGRTRQGLQTQNPDFYTFLNTAFDARNSWMPPRVLREAIYPNKP